ncbi:MAG: hypothetical protein ACOZAP_06220 [Pseudomonadota bacterium]
MEGMHDIIPPAPVSGGLTGLMAQGGLSHPVLLALLAGLLVLLALALGLLRHRLRAALRLALTRRALRAGRLDRVEGLIRRHVGLAHLHPGRPPAAIDAQAWHALVEGLHAVRFGTKSMPRAELAPLLGAVFTPSPSRGEGRGGGDERVAGVTPAPSPQPSPPGGEGEQAGLHP